MPFPTPYPFLLYGSRAIKVEDSICNLNKTRVFQSQTELTLILKQRTFSITTQQQKILPWNKVVVLPPVAHF